MNQIIEEILQDIYAVDQELKQYDMELKKALQKIIEAKPDTKFDEAFRLQLRSELLQKVEQLKMTKVKKKSVWNNFEKYFSWRVLFATPAFVLALVAIFLAYGEYQKNGGFFFGKQNVQFALSPTKEDSIGVEQNSKFILNASKDLPASTIEKIVVFEPEADFSVRKIKKTALIFPSVHASVEEVTKDNLQYQYELAPKKDLEGDKVYKISIQNEKIADREYQWAFQIKAPFGVTETIPGNKKTGIPLNGGIEIQFNRQLPEDYQKYFSISPKAEGTFEKKYDKLYFKPKNLEAKKVYTVTIKKDLISPVDKEVLEKDFVFSFETEKPDTEQDANDFSLVSTLTVANLAMQPLLQIGGNPGQEFDVDVYKLGGADEFIASYKLSKNFDLSWSSYAQDRNIDEYRPAENQKVLSVKRDLVDVNDGTYFELPQTLLEGYYFYEMKRGDVKKAGWIVSTDVAQYQAFSEGGNGLFWVYDFSAKKALSDVAVSFLSETEIALGKTNTEGILKYDAPEAMDYFARKGVQFFKITAPGKEPLITFANEHRYFGSEDAHNNFWNYLSLDKNKYRVTDTINYWGVLKGRKENIQGERLSVGLYQDCNFYWRSDEEENKEKNIPIVVEEIAVSDFDTISGKLAYAGIDASGSYCLAVKDLKTDRILETKYISVEKYSKPAYQITVEPSKKAAFAGEEIVFKIKSSFYDGTPVSNQLLKYNLGGQEKEIKLNSAGEGEVKYVEQFGEKASYPNSLIVTFSPVMAEEGDIWGSASVQIFGPKIELSSQTKKITAGKYLLSTEVRDIFLASDYMPEEDGNNYGGHLAGSYLKDPVANQAINAKVSQLVLVKKETGEYYDYITKTQQKTYAYETEEKVVGEFSGKTDERGIWKIEKSFEVTPDVSYRVDFSALDRTGKKAISSSYISLGMNGGDYISLEMNGEATGGYFEKSFSFGENVELKLNTSPEDKSVNDKTLFYRTQLGIDNTVVVDGYNFGETFSENFSPSVTYRAVIFTQYGFQESASTNAILKKENKRLEVEIKTEKENYRPGEEVNAEIVIRDRDNSPVLAEVNVAVVDEALFQNNADWNQNVLVKLYENVYAGIYSEFTQYAVRMKDNGMGGGGGDRSIFLDVPHYVTIRTDKSGVAKTNFKLPDNLTGWRLTARAFENKGIQAGQNNLVVSTGLPFFVDATLSEEYLIGDAPELKMRFFGNEYNPNQSVEYVVSSEELKLNQKGETKDATKYISLGALSQGEYSIRIEAKQGAQSDVLIRKIKVSGGYSMKKESRVQKLIDESKGIVGAETGYTKLVFMNTGKAKFFSTLSENANGIGVRLDQIVGAFLSKKLLAEKYYNREFVEEELNIEKFENYKEGEDFFGLSLLGYDDSNLELSAKVADASSDDALKKSRLKEFFTDAIYNSKADVHRISKALYGLAALGEPVLGKVNGIKTNQTDLTLEDKIYLGLALVKSGDREGAREYFETRIKSFVKNENGEVWIPQAEGSVEAEKLTANLGILVFEIKEQELAENIWRYLETHAPKRDLIVLEKTLMARAGIEKSKTEIDASFVLKTNARTEKFELRKNNQQEINLSKSELQTVRFEDVRGDVSVVSLFESVINEREIKNSPSLKLTRAYEVNGKETTTFSEGDLVKVILTPQFPIGENESAFYQVIDALPSGLKLAMVQSEMVSFNGEMRNDCNGAWYPDNSSGSRVVFDVQGNFAKESKCPNVPISYYARVISKGTFKADSAVLQSTNNLNEYFITSSSEVVIK